MIYRLQTYSGTKFIYIRPKPFSHHFLIIMLGYNHITLYNERRQIDNHNHNLNL
jgi:hypothetical protein